MLRPFEKKSSPTVRGAATQITTHFTYRSSNIWQWAITLF